MFCTVTKGKKHAITTYLDEIGNSVENIDDEGILDHTIAKLLPIITSLRAHLTQPIDDEDDVDIQDFEITEKFAPSQKNEVQLSFRKVNTPGRKKTKLPFKYVDCKIVPVGTQFVAIDYHNMACSFLIYIYIIACVLLFVARKPCTDEKQMLNDKLRRVGEDKITITKVCVSTYSYIHISIFIKQIWLPHIIIICGRYLLLTS